MATTEVQPPLRGITWTTDRALKFQRRSMLFVTIAPLAALVVAVVQLWGSGLSAVDAWIAGVTYVITALGITVGYHRYFTHRSFSAKRSLELTMAVVGTMAIQGSVIDWVATHRRHHYYSDRVGDPHSPHADFDEEQGLVGAVKGLFHAHVGWMFRGDNTIRTEWAPDLLDDPTIVRIDRAFPKLVIVSLALPAVLGFVFTGTLWGAFTAFVWGGVLRMFLLHHVTWSINSICHYYGTRPFESRDEARNNIPMALLSMGEGWHNGHHAFPASARHGLRWWELDVSWLTIRAFKAVRLVEEVKLPSATQLARRTRTADRATMDA
jgi:stearoyl-CoA desaturase (delta-9 desaturase)